MKEFDLNIWRLQAQFDTRGLIDALEHEDSSIRRRAATALRTLGAKEVVPTLQARLETESDPDVRAALLSAVAVLADEPESISDRAQTPEAKTTENAELARLVKQLKSDDQTTVLETIAALRQRKDKLAAEPLVLLFENPHTAVKVRLAAAEALLELESAPVEATLLGALRSPDWHVRRNSAAILGQLRADWAVEPLSKALEDEQESVRRTAYAALKHIGTPEALQALSVGKTGVAKVVTPPPQSDKPTPTVEEAQETGETATVDPALSASEATQSADTAAPQPVSEEAGHTPAEEPSGKQAADTLEEADDPNPAADLNPVPSDRAAVTESDDPTYEEAATPPADRAEIAPTDPVSADPEAEDKANLADTDPVESEQPTTTTSNQNESNPMKPESSSFPEGEMNSNPDPTDPTPDSDAEESRRNPPDVPPKRRTGLLARLDVSDDSEANPATSDKPETATDEEGESELVWPKLRDKQRAASLAPTQRLDPSVVEGMLGSQNSEDDETPDSDS